MRSAGSSPPFATPPLPQWTTRVVSVRSRTTLYTPRPKESNAKRLENVIGAESEASSTDSDLTARLGLKAAAKARLLGA